LSLPVGAIWTENGTMKSTDKFLIGIAAAIILLVVVAFLVVLTRPEPEYQSADSPEAIVHNYLLALLQADYERAHGYLSLSLKGYPENAQAFADDVDDSYSLRSDDRDVTIDTQSATIRGNMATVEVLETSFSSGDLFSSGNYSLRFDMKLRQENGEWKLVDGDRYWTSCWEKAPADDSYCW
jgi:hypothetical protein